MTGFVVLKTFVLGDALKEEGIKLVSALIVLGITWWGGYLLLAEWEIKKKSREIDLTLAIEFQKLFGEFKEVWRLWKVCRPRLGGPAQSLAESAVMQPGSNLEPVVGGIPLTATWDLLSRASSAEGRVEAILLKLASDRNLDDDKRFRLGLFRQAFQVLRQGIRDGESLDYSYKHPRYRLFNQLGAEVAQIIIAKTKDHHPDAKGAAAAFQAILDVRIEDLKKEEAKPEYDPKAAGHSYQR